MASVAVRGVSTCPDLDIFQGQLLRRETKPLRAGEIRKAFELIIDEWVPLRPADDPASAVTRQVVKHLGANLLGQYGIDSECFDVVCIFNHQALPPDATQGHAKVIWFCLKLLPEVKKKEERLISYVLRPRNGRPLEESGYVLLGDNYFVPNEALQYYKNELAARVAGRSGGPSTSQTIGAAASQSSQVVPVGNVDRSQRVEVNVSEQCEDGPAVTNDRTGITSVVQNNVQQVDPVVVDPVVATAPTYPAASNAASAFQAQPVFQGSVVASSGGNTTTDIHHDVQQSDPTVQPAAVNGAASAGISAQLVANGGAPPSLLFPSAASTLVGVTGLPAQPAQSVRSVPVAQNNGIHPAASFINQAPVPISAAPTYQHVVPTLGLGTHAANHGAIGPQGSATTSGFVPQTHQNVNLTTDSLPITSQPQLNTTNVPFPAGYTGLQAPQPATVPAAAAGQQLGPTIAPGTHTTNQSTSTIHGSMTGALGPPTQQMGHVANNVPFGKANIGLQPPLNNVRPFAHFSLPHAAPVLPPPQAAPAAANASVLPSAPIVGVAPTMNINILPAVVVPAADVDVVMIDAWLLDVFEAAARLLELLGPVVGPRAL